MAEVQNIISEIQMHAREFIEIRHRIHAHPELGLEEIETSRLVAEKLSEWGYEVTTGIGCTGVVGRLKVGQGERSIGIRADMDALPINEETGLPYASKIHGTMHACGHDGHTAVLLAAAHHLSQTRNFDGTLNLIFQPAEEGQGGAQRMMDDGLFERFPCDAVYALHNIPGIPVGQFLVFTGVSAAASVDNVTITLTGKGTHGAYPARGNDPIVAAASIVMALQTIVSRNIPADSMAVVTIGSIQAGAAANVIPETASVLMTVRTLDPEIRSQIESRVFEIVDLQARSFGVTAKIDYHPITRVLVNTAGEAALAREVITDLVGTENVNTQSIGMMGGEDFSWMLEKVPGCYVGLGNGIGSFGGCFVHNPGYDFNDDALPIGASYWVKLVERYLATGDGHGPIIGRVG